MPNLFDSFSDGDIIHASHVEEMHAPIQNLERGAAFYAGPSGGSSTAYTATLSPEPDNPYQGGMIVNFKVHTPNTVGSPDVTLNVNGVGAKPVVKNGGDSLAAGDLKADQIVSVVYDDVAQQFNLLSVSSASAVVSSLDDLSDVTISSPASGQVVRYNGSNFANASLTASDMPSGIDAAKIGSGGVSNTEFGYLDGVTSAIQTQLSATSNATNITSGQLGLARGGTGADLSATGGTGQVLKQSTSGGAVTVGALSGSEMPTGIDAAKIGGGAVSNTEFSYLDGVTSAVQTQLNNTHNASNITSGQIALARGGTGSDLSATGGSGQVLKQSTSGGAISVGALAAGDMPSGIDATKIAGGTVSNTEFGYLDGVTSALQTQISNLDAPGLLYGDGSDGNVTISSGTTQLTRIMFYNNLTVNSGAVLMANGCEIYVRGTLTNNGTIQSNGYFGSGFSGAPGSIFTRFTGGDGPNGGFSNANGNSVALLKPILYSAYGGTGGSASSYYGGSHAFNTVNNLGAGMYRTTSAITSGLGILYPVSIGTGIVALGILAGGVGGGSGAAYGGAYGGGAGAGGDFLRVFARNVSGSGTVQANGGNGGNASGSAGQHGGGGGGGGGGVVLIVSSSASHSFTLSATGGIGGNAYGASGTAGANGSAGTTLFIGGVR